MPDPVSRIGALLTELRRRRIFRVAALYLLGAWAVIEVTSTVFPILLLPEVLTRAVVVLSVLGLPVALALAWAYDVTPEGIRRTSRGEPPRPPEGGREAPFVPGPAVRPLFIGGVALLTLVAGWAAWSLWLQPRARAEATRTEEATDWRSALEPDRVAVLYFDDFSEGGRLGYLADGITEALIHDLSQLEPLEVVSRNGVKPYRGGTAPLDSIARALGAGTLVEGSVEGNADRLVGTVQLIDGRDGTHLLSRRFERRGKDLLALRDDIVAEAGRLLGRRLGETLELERSRAGTRSDEAWALVRRAAALRDEADTLRWSLGEEAAARATLMRTDSLLAEAESRDPAWMEPVVQRGWLREQMAAFPAGGRAAADEESLRVGIAHAERALGETPGLPAALALRGALRYDLAWLAGPEEAERLYDAAEADLRAALAADASVARAWVELAHLLRTRGAFAEASVAARKALEADPFLIHAEKEILFTLAHVWLELQELERALRWTEEGRRRYPAELSFAFQKLVILAGWPGADVPVDSARVLLRQIETAYGMESWPLGRLQLAAVLALAGEADSARALAARVREASPDDPWADYYEANVRVRLGENDRAIRLLASFLEAMPQRREYIASDWWWEPLREDSDFRVLVEGTGGAVSPAR